MSSDEYPFIIHYLISGAWFEGSSGMKGRLLNSLLVIGSLPLVPSVLCLM